ISTRRENIFQFPTRMISALESASQLNSPRTYWWTTEERFAKYSVVAAPMHASKIYSKIVECSIGGVRSRHTRERRRCSSGAGTTECKLMANRAIDGDATKLSLPCARHRGR